MHSRASTLLLAIALFAASGLVVSLGRQNQKLRDRVGELARANRTPRAGLFTPTFRTTSLSGEELSVGVRGDSGRQLLFFFTTTCPYCRASLPAWREIAEAAKRLPAPTTQVIGVALDSASRARVYVQQHDLEFPVVTLPERKLAFLYRATAVPVVLMLNNEGRIMYSRTGVLRDRVAIDSVIAALRWQPPAKPRAAETALVSSTP